jgi:hypothetical protein
VSVISLSSRVERNPELVWTDMDGETVMMSRELGQYFGLGGVGSRIWTLLAEPVTAGEICRRIAIEFDVDGCEADVVPFLGKLLEVNVIRLC